MVGTLLSFTTAVESLELLCTSSVLCVYACVYETPFSVALCVCI